MSRKRAVMVVEDESAISDLVAFHLEQSGFEPIVAGEGKRAFELTKEKLPSLIILDLMLPDMDGLEILAKYRAEERSARLPIILLTAKAEEGDRIMGLETGADDYVVKPFSPRELMLRVEKLIKSREYQSEENSIITFGCLEIDEEKFSVRVEGNEIDISVTEMRLLNELLRSRGKALSRGQLLQNAWGYLPNVTERTVDTHVKRLRQKLGAASEYLETIRGVGYRWIEQPGE